MKFPRAEQYEHINHPRARKLQRQADVATWLRDKLATPTGIVIASTSNRLSPTSVAVTLFTGAGMALDKVDGTWGKKSQILEHGKTGKPLTEGGREDPKADHKFMSRVFLGIEIRAVRDGDAETAVIMGAARAVQDVRDARYEAGRDLVEAQGLEEEVSVSARQISRWGKMALQTVSTLALVSPLSRNKTVRRTALAGVATSVGFGVVGQQQFSADVQQVLANRGQPSV